MPRRLIAPILLLTFASGPALADDRIFHHENGALTRFDGRPMWEGAAFCAALADGFELRFPIWRAAWAAQRDMLTPDERDNPRYAYPAEREVRARAEAPTKRAPWKAFAEMRLTRDRPGQPVAAIFETRVAEELARLQADPPADREELSSTDYSCSQYYQAIEWNYIRMRRGWADQTDGGN